jgi:hypothetical protein
MHFFFLLPIILTHALPGYIIIIIVPYTALFFFRFSIFFAATEAHSTAVHICQALRDWLTRSAAAATPVGEVESSLEENTGFVPMLPH